MTDEAYKLHQYLSRARNTEKAIKQIELTINDMRTEMNRPIQAINYTDMPKGSGGTESIQEKLVEKLSEIENSLDSLRYEKAETFKEVCDILLLVSAVDSLSYSCMLMYYVREKKIEDIAKELDIDTSTFFRRRDRGIRFLLSYQDIKDKIL